MIASVQPKSVRKVRLIVNGLKGFQYGYYQQKLFYALNFLAFGTFSPLRILSAPTFLPSLGQPYFGPNKLRNMLQEEPVVIINAQARISIIWRDLGFICFSKDVGCLRVITMTKCRSF